MLLVSMATMLGTSELMTEDLNRKQESDNSKRKVFKRCVFWYLVVEEQFSYAPDVEAMVGIRSVFGPLEQRPFKLHRYLGNRVRR